MAALPAMHEAHQRVRDSSVAEPHVNKPPGRGSTRTMTITAFEDCPPESAQVTAYDERHFATYLRLLDADEEGADWREAVRIIFGVDPDREPERARIVHDSHLARARWMTQGATAISCVRAHNDAAVLTRKMPERAKLSNRVTTPSRIAHSIPEVYRDHAFARMMPESALQGLGRGKATHAKNGGLALAGCGRCLEGTRSRGARLEILETQSRISRRLSASA
jgi:hypothetical protein